MYERKRGIRCTSRRGKGWQGDSSADLLIRHADQAMYSAKQAGKNQYYFFTNGV